MGFQVPDLQLAESRWRAADRHQALAIGREVDGMDLVGTAQQATLDV